MIALLAQATSQPAPFFDTIAVPTVVLIPLTIAVIAIGCACYFHGKEFGYLDGVDVGIKRGADSSDQVRRWVEQSVLNAFARHESPTTHVVSVLRKALDLIESPPPAPQETPEEDDDDDGDDDDEDEDEEDDDE